MSHPTKEDQMNTEIHRPKLDTISHDDTLPRAFRTDLKRGLSAYDDLTELHQAASDCSRLASDTLDSRRRDEAHRLHQRAMERQTPTVDEVLPGYEALIEQKRVYDDRQAATRGARVNAWHYANTRVFSLHAPALLEWVTAQRASEPWSQPLAEHVYDVWHRIAGRFTFELPMVAKHHRFVSLKLKPATPAMVRTWAALHEGDVTKVDEQPGRTTYRVTAYWPELTEEPKIA